MSTFLKQLRERLKKQQEKKNVVSAFKRVPKKDISFLPASSAPETLTSFANQRIAELMASVGGEDKFVDGDFTIQYIDKSSKADFVKVQEVELQAEKSKEAGTYDEFDFEPKTITETTVLKQGLSADAVQFYMITIEYIQLIEVQ
tara:strand:- start:4162 stop:4596 length:435 start_codon:yes stop_codon:yes gene_type:complete